jgi:hypothetical protein
MEDTAQGVAMGKPWLKDTVYVIQTGPVIDPVFRAQPPTKVVNNGQIVTWKAKKGNALDMKDQYGFTDISVDPSGIVTAKVAALPGDIFEYTMTCNGSRVEGNSPPVIVVE